MASVHPSLSVWRPYYLQNAIFSKSRKFYLQDLPHSPHPPPSTPFKGGQALKMEQCVSDHLRACELLRPEISLHSMIKDQSFPCGRQQFTYSGESK